MIVLPIDWLATVPANDHHGEVILLIAAAAMTSDIVEVSRNDLFEAEIEISARNQRPQRVDTVLPIPTVGALGDPVGDDDDLFARRQLEVGLERPPQIHALSGGEDHSVASGLDR